jgi:hypothetical protein
MTKVSKYSRESKKTDKKKQSSQQYKPNQQLHSGLEILTNLRLSLPRLEQHQTNDQERVVNQIDNTALA